MEIKKFDRIKPAKPAVKPGIKGLNSILKEDFLEGDIITVAGGTGCSKTAFALEMFLNATKAGKKPGLIISFDEKEEELKKLADDLGLEVGNDVAIAALFDTKKMLAANLKKLKSYVEKNSTGFVLINSIRDFKTQKTLIREFKASRVTQFLVYPDDDAVAGDISVSKDSVYRSSDVVFLLSYRVENGLAKRYISALKAKGEFSPAARKFLVTGKGIRVEEEAAPLSYYRNEQKKVNALLMVTDLNISKFVIADYEKHSPKISLSITEHNAAVALTGHYRQYIDTLTDSIRTGTFKYDVFGCEVRDVKRLAAQGLILPIGADFKYSEQGTFYPAVLKECYHNGLLCAIPDFLHTFSLFYRRDILKKYGVKTPLTWEELSDAVKYIMGKDKRVEAGIVYPNAGRSLTNVFCTHVINGLSDRSNTAGELLNSSNYAGALKFMKEGTKNKLFAEQFGKNCGWTESRQKFMEGRALFMHCHDIDYNDHKKEAREKEGIIPFPSYRYPGMGACVASAMAYVIPSSAQNPTYCYDFLKFLLSKEEDIKVHEACGYERISSRDDVNRALGEKHALYVDAALRGRDTFLMPDSLLGEDFEELTVDCVKKVLEKGDSIESAVKETESRLKFFRRARYYDSAIKAAVVFMENNYGKKLYLKEIAASVNMGPNHFERFFKERTKSGVFDFLTKVRIEKAKQLLRDVYSCNITEVSEKVGFSDPKYFATLFRKHTGMTPTEFRLSQER